MVVKVSGVHLEGWGEGGVVALTEATEHTLLFHFVCQLIARKQRVPTLLMARHAFHLLKHLARLGLLERLGLLRAAPLGRLIFP